MDYVEVTLDKDTDPDIMQLVLDMELRPLDLLECALVGATDDSTDIILHGILASGMVYCKAGFNLTTGLPEFIFGVSATDSPDIGTPWLLGTTDFVITKEWLKMCKYKIFPQMDGTFPILKNYVHKDNVESIRWLKWLGFTFYDIPVIFTDEQTEPVPMYLFVKLGGTPLCVAQQH
jgi:hypothetical protein